MDNLDYAKKVAISMCKKYEGRNITFVELYKLCLDKIDELLEQHKGDESYDIAKDPMFSWHLRQNLTRMIAERSGGSRIDVKNVYEVNKYLETIKKYIIENAKIPKDEEMADMLNVDLEEIKRIKNLLNEGKQV